MSETNEELPKTNNPPEEFYKLVNDFITDILITFPEYTQLISKWWNRPCENIEESKKKETLFLFKHCIKVYPERFFDILYKNADMFKEESTINTEFLPGIVFKHLWTCDISENTRETIWKYLQLILFSVIGTVNSTNELGDTAKLFEAINEDELKNKLQETLEGIQKLFEENKNMNASDIDENASDEQTDAKINIDNLPNAQDLHEHISSMMNGKLGKLAMELADETANELNLDMENTGNVSDVFQKLIKNPNKMMNMVKNIGSKIDDKIKSGELKESELMEEGMELLNKMKDMPGMGDMQKLFSQMGMQMPPGLNKNTKVNVGAMEAQLSRNMKNAKLKERMRAKVEANARAKEQQTMLTNNSLNASQAAALSEEELIKIFSTGEKVEKTPRGAKPPEKNKKGKKKA